MFSIRCKSCIKLCRNRPSINKYNLERIKYPSNIDDWKMVENNNLIISLNVS